jgi:hypothetical protein
LSILSSAASRGSGVAMIDNMPLYGRSAMHA